MPEDIHPYRYISSNLHPSTKLQVAKKCGTKVRAECTTWSINVAKWAKLGQNGLKMGGIVRFEHPKWSKITFGKTRF